MEYARWEVVNSFMRPTPKTAGHVRGEVGDAFRKRNSGAARSDRGRIRKENDAELALIFREYGARCAKCLFEGHIAL